LVDNGAWSDDLLKLELLEPSADSFIHLGILAVEVFLILLLAIHDRQSSEVRPLLWLIPIYLFWFWLKSRFKPLFLTELRYFELQQLTFFGDLGMGLPELDHDGFEPIFDHMLSSGVI